MKKWLPSLLLLFSLVFWALVLKNEFGVLLRWWSILLLVGISFFPLSAKIFSTLPDKGYLFSKGIGIAVTSYVLWFLSFLGILPIRAGASWSVVIVSGLILYALFFRKKEEIHSALHGEEQILWVFSGESLFLFSLGFWTYLRGFNPRVEGLEKFMDYGFVNSILRSERIPPMDMWFAGETINYYYYGQYVTAFLTQLSGIETRITYNLMMATLFAFSMGLCFIFAASLIRGYGIKKKTPVIIGGLISASLVSLGGNLHAFFYGFLNKLLGKEGAYWFPNATRFIGYNPETRDKTIHEFPVYSFVVSDLHAHVINMFFVLTILGILYAVFKKVHKRTEAGWQPQNLLSEIFIPELLLLGFFIGIFQMTNYWDFPIYLTVTLFTLICAGIRQSGYGIKTAGIVSARFLIVLLSSLVFALPFNLDFERMTAGIRFTQDRSFLYQLLVLWGYQLVFACLFVIYLLYAEQNIRWKKEKGKVREKIRNELTLFARIRNVLEKSPIEDVFTVILLISAIGLIILPEMVYVVDIYSGEHKRANTMFKLTYQAFIMFGLSVGYITMRIRQYPWKDWKNIVTRILTVIMIILPMIYPFYAIPSWYKNMDPARYESLDGLTFLEREYPDDYALVQWLNENIEGQPVILEANGDSYSYYGRISMATGLPTILGWYVHQWLWRDNVTLVSARADEVKLVYESEDIDATRAVLSKYEVGYIVIGDLERKKFHELKEDKLMGFGTVIFERPTMILIRVE